MRVVQPTAFGLVTDDMSACAEALAAGCGNHLGILEPGVGVEDGQKPAGDQVEDAQVVAAQLAPGQLAGGDDGVVVGHLAVIHVTPAERFLSGAGRHQRAN